MKRDLCRRLIWKQLAAPLCGAGALKEQLRTSGNGPSQLPTPTRCCAAVLCSLMVSSFSQTGWLAPSAGHVGGPPVMNVFPFLWSPLYCFSMPGRMKNRLKRQETDTERMFGCWLLSYQPFSHLMKQLSALRLIKYPPDAGQSCRVARR